MSRGYPSYEHAEPLRDRPPPDRHREGIQKMAEGRDQQDMQRKYQEIVSDLDQVDQKLIRKVRMLHRELAV